jgi:hypothetical protein
MNPVINEFGTKIWHNDKFQFHREDGPAIEFNDGSKAWFINGKEHRLDGPAIERISGIKYWYIDGVKINCKDNEEFLRIVKLKELL